nr:hypothetical protein B0A51_15607 [Rachicladosporium sp. CCFEE 5018]
MAEAGYDPAAMVTCWRTLREGRGALRGRKYQSSRDASSATFTDWIDPRGDYRTPSRMSEGLAKADFVRKYVAARKAGADLPTSEFCPVKLPIDLLQWAEFKGSIAEPDIQPSWPSRMLSAPLTQ